MTKDERRLLDALREVADILRERQLDEAMRLKRAGHDDDEIVMLLEEESFCARVWILRELNRLLPDPIDRDVLRAAEATAQWPELTIKTIQ